MKRLVKFVVSLLESVGSVEGFDDVLLFISMAILVFMVVFKLMMAFVY